MATAAQLQRLMRRMEPRLQRAFMESIEAIRSRAGVSALEAAIASNDLEAAIRAAGIRDSSFTALSEAVRSTYRESAEAIMGFDVPKRFSAEFNMSNPRAQQWIQQRSSELITGDILPKQREAIRTVMSSGFQQGRNPRSVALDIVGRISKQTGQRTGGVLGLHDEFAQYVTNARSDLTNLDSRYFSRKARNKRFDAMVRRSIENGTPLDQATIDRITTDYEARLTRIRGETVARTETLPAQNAANQEAMNQVVEEGLAEEGAIIRIWDASGDSLTRPEHAAANGQRRGLNEPFEVGGVRMMRPGDMDAPVHLVANCRCVVRNQVDFSRTVL